MKSSRHEQELLKGSTFALKAVKEAFKLPDEYLEPLSTCLDISQVAIITLNGRKARFLMKCRKKLSATYLRWPGQRISCFDDKTETNKG